MAHHDIDRSIFPEIKALLLENRVTLVDVRLHVEHELAERRHKANKLQAAASSDKRNKNSNSTSDSNADDADDDGGTEKDIAAVVAELNAKAKKGKTGGADSTGEQVEKLRGWKPTTISDPSGNHAVIQADLEQLTLSRAERVYLQDRAPRRRHHLLTPRHVVRNEDEIRNEMRSKRQAELEGAYAEMRRALMAVSAQQHQQQQQPPQRLTAAQTNAAAGQATVPSVFVPGRAVISSVTATPPLPEGWKRVVFRSKVAGDESHGARQTRQQQQQQQQESSRSSSSSSSSSSSASSARHDDGQQQQRKKRSQPALAIAAATAIPQLRSDFSKLEELSPSRFCEWKISGRFLHEEQEREREAEAEKKNTLIGEREKRERGEHDEHEAESRRKNKKAWSALIEGQLLPPAAADVAGGAVAISRRLRHLRNEAALTSALAMGGGSMQQKGQLLERTAHMSSKYRRNMTVGALTLIGNAGSTYKAIQAQKNEKRRQRSSERRREKESAAVAQQQQQQQHIHASDSERAGAAEVASTAGVTVQLARRPSQAQIAAAFDRRGLVQLSTASASTPEPNSTSFESKSDNNRNSNDSMLTVTRFSSAVTPSPIPLGKLRHRSGILHPSATPSECEGDAAAGRGPLAVAAPIAAAVSSSPLAVTLPRNLIVRKPTATNTTTTRTDSGDLPATALPSSSSMTTLSPNTSMVLNQQLARKRNLPLASRPDRSIPWTGSVAAFFRHIVDESATAISTFTAAAAFSSSSFPARGPSAASADGTAGAAAATARQSSGGGGARGASIAAAQQLATMCFATLEYGLADYYHKQQRSVESFPWSAEERTAPAIKLLADLIARSSNSSSSDDAAGRKNRIGSSSSVRSQHKQHEATVSAAHVLSFAFEDDDDDDSGGGGGDLGNVLALAGSDAIASRFGPTSSNSFMSSDGNSMGENNHNNIIVHDPVFRRHVAEGAQKKLGSWVAKVRRVLDRAVGPLDVPEEDDKVEEQELHQHHNDHHSHHSHQNKPVTTCSGGHHPAHHIGHHPSGTAAVQPSSVFDEALRANSSGVVLLSKEEKRLLVRDVFGGGGGGAASFAPSDAKPPPLLAGRENQHAFGGTVKGNNNGRGDADGDDDDDATGDVVTKHQGLASMAAAQKLGLLEPVMKQLPNSFLFSNAADIIIRGFAGVDLGVQQQQQQENANRNKEEGKKQQQQVSGEHQASSQGGAARAITSAAEDENFLRFVELTKGTEAERLQMQNEENFGRGIVMRAQSTLDRIRARQEKSRGAATAKLFARLEERRRAAESIMSQRRGGGGSMLSNISEDAEKRAKVWKLLRMPPEMAPRRSHLTTTPSLSSASFAGGQNDNSGSGVDKNSSNIWGDRLSQLEKNEKNTQQCRLICIRAVLALLSTAFPPSDEAVDLLGIFCDSVLNSLPELSTSQFLRWLKRSKSVLFSSGGSENVSSSTPANPTNSSSNNNRAAEFTSSQQRQNLPRDCWFLMMWLRSELGVSGKAHAAWCEMHRKAGWKYEVSVLG